MWSGGSTASMCRAKARPGSPSSTTSGLPANAATMSFDRLPSISAVTAASCPRTSQASCPSARRTWRTGHLFRIDSKYAYGSFWMDVSQPPQVSVGSGIVRPVALL